MKVKINNVIKIEPEIGKFTKNSYKIKRVIQKFDKFTIKIKIWRFGQSHVILNQLEGQSIYRD